MGGIEDNDEQKKSCHFRHSSAVSCPASRPPRLLLPSRRRTVTRTAQLLWSFKGGSYLSDSETLLVVQILPFVLLVWQFEHWPLFEARLAVSRPCGMVLWFCLAVDTKALRASDITRSADQDNKRHSDSFGSQVYRCSVCRFLDFLHIATHLREIILYICPVS